MFDNVTLVGIGDINADAANARGEEFEVPVFSVKELLGHPDIDIIVNLTIPKVHAEVSRQILDAGKHVYSEKPLAISFDEGKDLLDYAAAKGLRIGCAPDTFLGAGHQTCRQVIDDGWIGDVISGTAFMMSRGPEAWHPNPHFFYQAGAGPMFDMGPYYITALVHLLGPVKEITAVTTKGFEERLATCEEHFGEKLPVEIPTHYAGVLSFQDGQVITLTISFDVIRHGHSNIELYGSHGSLKVPDPNTFGGDVQVFKQGYEDWATLGYTHGYHENSRGFGVADMAMGIEKNRPHRASGELSLHVLEIMESFEKAHLNGGRIGLQTSCKRPEALPLNIVHGKADL